MASATATALAVAWWVEWEVVVVLVVTLDPSASRVAAILWDIREEYHREQEQHRHRFRDPRRHRQCSYHPMLWLPRSKRYSKGFLEVDCPVPIVSLETEDQPLGNRRTPTARPAFSSRHRVRRVPSRCCSSNISSAARRIRRPVLYSHHHHRHNMPPATPSPPNQQQPMGTAAATSAVPAATATATTEVTATAATWATATRCPMSNTMSIRARDHSIIIKLKTHSIPMPVPVLHVPCLWLCG